MNKAFYIIGIVFSFVFFCVSAYYVEEVSSARIMEMFSSFDSYGGYGSSYSSYSYLSSSASDLTTEAGLIALFFLLVVIFTDIMGLIKVKPKPQKHSQSLV